MTFAATILTLYPEMFPGPLGVSLAGEGLRKGLWSLDTHQIREHGIGRHRNVDDNPAGGGAGMVLRADGGMVASDWTMQALADILAVPVDRPKILETTALGAAWLAGMKAGVWPDQHGFAASWRLQRRFESRMGESDRRQWLAGWRDAVKRTVVR